MGNFRKNFKPTIDEKMKTFLTLYDYIKENKTSCIDCENLEVKNAERFKTTKYSSVCKISGECVLYPKYCNNYKFSDKTKKNIINCWIDILCKGKDKEHMKKVCLEELKDKDLYLDDDGKIIVREKSNSKFVPLVGEKYYYVNYDYEIIEKRYLSDCFDKFILSKDYVFATEEEAEEYSKYLSALKQYKYNFTIDELKNANIKKFYIEYRIDEDRITYNSYRYLKQNKISFETEDDCEKFIEEAGKENIKKFLFDIWE